MRNCIRSPFTRRVERQLGVEDPAVHQAVNYILLIPAFTGFYSGDVVVLSVRGSSGSELLISSSGLEKDAG